MTDEHRTPDGTTEEDRYAGWSVPAEMVEASPSYMPAVLALGIVCLLWGITTTWLISMVGAGLVVVALTGWIGELRHEWRDWRARAHEAGAESGHGQPR